MRFLFNNTDLTLLSLGGTLRGASFFMRLPGLCARRAFSISKSIAPSSAYRHAAGKSTVPIRVPDAMTEAEARA
jgi:hypothetical protein